MLFLTREPLWLLGFLLVGLTTILACLGPLFVRRFVTLEKLRANNEVAGFKFATVGTLYALCRQRAPLRGHPEYSADSSSCAS
jgi:hypothetical protein